MRVINKTIRWRKWIGLIRRSVNGWSIDLTRIGNDFHFSAYADTPHAWRIGFRSIDSNVFRSVKLPRIEALREAARYLRLWPIYFGVWSRDCDCCEVTFITRFPTYYHAKRGIRAIYRHAEGPVRVWQVRRSDYLEHKPTIYDRAADMAGY